MLISETMLSVTSDVAGANAWMHRHADLQPLSSEAL